MMPKALADALESRYSEIEWKGMRSFRVYFTDESKKEPIDILCKQVPAMNSRLERDEKENLIEPFWICKTPFQIAIRKDDVEAIVENIYGVEVVEMEPGDEVE